MEEPAADYPVNVRREVVYDVGAHQKHARDQVQVLFLYAQEQGAGERLGKQGGHCERSAYDAHDRGSCAQAVRVFWHQRGYGLLAHVHEHVGYEDQYEAFVPDFGGVERSFHDLLLSLTNIFYYTIIRAVCNISL